MHVLSFHFINILYLFNSNHAGQQNFQTAEYSRDDGKVFLPLYRISMARLLLSSTPGSVSWPRFMLESIQDREM